ncbi:MAG: tetratricopeptide repeat protein [Pyrinomonadaceae bacterium]
MIKTCPGCGADAPPEARFCRHCGTALRVTTGGDAGGATVSPLAATMPLTDQGITTGALEAGAPHFSTPPVPPAQEPVAHASSTSPSGEITIPVVRAAQQTTTDLPAPTSAAAKQSSPLAEAPPISTPSPRTTTQAPERRAMRVWLVGGVLVVVVLLLCGTAAGLWFLFRMQRAPAAANADAPVVVPADARQQAQAKIAEAQKLLAAGDPVAATTRLREAIALDAANAEAHRQLAQLLLESGARQTAMEELRTVTQLEPNDKDAWRQLAETQFAEGAYAAAADSYHTLLEVSNEAATDDRLQLAYADALRLAGRTDNARALYRRLATSPLADVAHASKQRLTELTALPADSAASAPTQPDGTTATNGAQTASPANHTPALPAPERQPTPASVVANTPAEHYERGVSMWGTNRAAAITEFRAAANAGNPDAYYYLGLSLAEGRDAHALNRAELVAALEYFQRARQGRFSPQARRYEEQLGQEFDRRRKQ